MRRLAALVFLTATVAWAGGEPAPSYSVYLLRHAEKTAEADDPGLAPTGIERVQRLAGWARGRDIARVYSSDYRRTRDTATPIAEALGAPLTIYDPRELEAFASLLAEHEETALVVGHSNTTPQLAALLCGCEAPPMDESVYDRIYVVTVSDERASLDVRPQPLP